jgi:hypothetical protein
MSINIYFDATREVVVVKTGRTDTQSISFDTWQTPCIVTEQIMSSKDRVQAYKDWVLAERCDELEQEVYADDDLFQERLPIGTTFINPGKEHLEMFVEWLQMCEEEGYTVEASAF